MNYILLVVLFIGVIIVYIPMPRRKHYRKNKFKLKLKKGTIYSIFAFGFIVVGIILLLSFTKNGNSFLMINNLLGRYFGSVAILFPFVLIFFGFLFLKLRLFLSGINVSIGFLLFFISLDALLKQGMAGKEFFKILSDVLTDIGANVVYFAGVLVGLIVFFNTSVDQVVEFVQRIFKNLYRLFPSQLRGFFKNKKSSGFKENPMRIKGGSKIIPNLSTGPMVINSSTINKEPPLIADQLVSNSIRAKVVEVNEGPAVTQYALQVGLGTKLSKITALANDLALRTEAPTGQIRIEAPIPGRNLVGIEIPNRSLEIVTLKTMLESSVMNKSKSKLTVSLGLDVSGNPVVANIAKMPHVLIAGTTGSGKSVLINSFISSLLFRASPSEVKLILIDPKRVELTGYNGIPHLMVPVIVDVEKILSALKWATNEMDRRYKTFAERGVRNIDGYNELAGFQALPYIIILVDELADLMMFAPVEVEDTIARLAQMARATGVHLVVSTQRPSVDVITGLIKANIPCRIAFNVSSMIDSRVILDTPGAEKLLGRGDMLYIPPEQAKPTRIQGAFVSEKEVKKLVDFLKEKGPPVEYTEEVISKPLIVKKLGGTSGADGKDALFEEAIRVVCQYDRASASLLQRRLSIGYSRAARILDQLQEAGIVGH